MTLTINSVGHLDHNADHENLEVYLKNCPAGNYLLYLCKQLRKHFIEKGSDCDCISPGKIWSWCEGSSIWI